MCRRKPRAGSGRDCSGISATQLLPHERRPEHQERRERMDAPSRDEWSRERDRCGGHERGDAGRRTRRKGRAFVDRPTGSEHRWSHATRVRERPFGRVHRCRRREIVFTYGLIDPAPVFPKLADRPIEDVPAEARDLEPVGLRQSWEVSYRAQKFLSYQCSTRFNTAVLRGADRRPGARCWAI